MYVPISGPSYACHAVEYSKYFVPFILSYMPISGPQLISFFVLV